MKRWIIPAAAAACLVAAGATLISQVERPGTRQAEVSAPRQPVPAESRRADAARSGPNVLSINSVSPVVAFDVHVAGEDGVINLPPFAKEMVDRVGPDGVYVTSIDGVEYRHIASISTQISHISNNDLDMDGALLLNNKISESARRVINWLYNNYIDIGDGAVVWHYTFDYSFNDIFIKSNWPSSFAQADVIKSLVLSYRRSGDGRYLDLAKRAAYAFTVPCERGGLRCVVGGVPWFEEIPVPYGYAPMILNGHLYSVVMLHRLWKETGDLRVKQAYDEGLNSARTMLGSFDTGYWSRYQVRPRAVDLLILVRRNHADAKILEVSVSSPFTGVSSLSLEAGKTSTFSSNSTWVSSDQPADKPDPEKLISFLLRPGRFAIGNDPINFPGFDVAVRYAAPACAPVSLGTFDWRATTKDWMALPNVSIEAVGEECVARAKLPNEINLWSQLTPFYHDWHTRLILELARISDDPTFYTTGVRWRRYATVQKEHAAAGSSGQLLSPIFDMSESREDDEVVKLALGGGDPASISDEQARERLLAYARSHSLSPDRQKSLLARIGHEPS